MRSADLAAVGAIADRSYPDHPEDAAIFRERLTLFPEGCFVLDDDGAVSGYVISHPAIFGEPPRLNRLLGRIPAYADCYYIHDLALLPSAQGTGAARRIIARIAGIASRSGFSRVALVAVNGSMPFWAACGFAPEPAVSLASYGPGSAYLSARSKAA